MKIRSYLGTNGITDTLTSSNINNHSSDYAQNSVSINGRNESGAGMFFFIIGFMILIVGIAVIFWLR